MRQFAMMVLLLFMLAPAFFAVLFAGRSLLFLAWNLVWFWVISIVAEGAFDSEKGRIIGVFFALWYVWRAMTRPQSSEKFIFRKMSYNGFPRSNSQRVQQEPQAAQKPTPLSANPAVHEVIDADFTVS